MRFTIKWITRLSVLVLLFMIIRTSYRYGFMQGYDEADMRSNYLESRVDLCDSIVKGI